MVSRVMPLPQRSSFPAAVPAAATTPALALVGRAPSTLRARYAAATAATVRAQLPWAVATFLVTYAAVAIFELQARQKGMIYAEDVLDKVRSVIPPAPRGHNFGNGRFIRNVLEEAVSNQATRLSASDPDSLTERDLRELIPSDVRPPTSMRAEDYLLQKPGT